MLALAWLVVRLLPLDWIAPLFGLSGALLFCLCLMAAHNNELDCVVMETMPLFLASMHLVLTPG